MNRNRADDRKDAGLSSYLPPCSTEKAGCVSGRGPHSVGIRIVAMLGG
jgi:hypothetical protein